MRITPAYTGKRLKIGECSRLGKDHPRIHGEKEKTEVTSYEELGSPPHTRGKALNRCNISNTYRITPAYTGKSDRLDGAVKISWDHPRIHGEKINVKRLENARKGSPPHTRGKGIRV